MDQSTDVHLPSSLKLFTSHSPDMTIPPSLGVHINSQGPGLAAGDVEMNLIAQPQEEVGGYYARGRHEIVVGNATIVVNESQ